MPKEEILSLIAKQKEYFPSSELRDPKNRVAVLKELYQNIVDMQEEIFAALKADLNKSEVESYMAEVGIVLSEISYMIRHCRKFAKIKRVRTPIAQFTSKSYKLPCPYGSVLIISPWNYPFMLSLDPLVDAIAAGNSVVLKPSETSPHVSDVIAKLISKTFKQELAFVVRGGRDEVSYLLDQQFDYIFFTGSTRVGKIVMQKAAEHFTPVTLEMGGKSPCIVDETANIKLAAKRIVFGKFLNSGQTCVAPDYLYCHRSIKDELIHEIKRQIVLQYSVDPVGNDSYPRMISQKQFDGVAGLICNDKILFGGKTNSAKLKIEPTLVDASFEDEIMQTEIFGPVLPVVTFENVDEVITRVNNGGKPLALYIFSSNKENQEKITKYCEFGGGCINDTIIHIATSNMGFGGLRESGIGSYHGKAGFDSFTHYKSIVDKKTWLDLPMRYQPHTKIKYSLIKKFLK
ncbi:MAG: aldehyde dehydrogenase [Clostridia bacterium]|nr:aldehyde dehydrogenase [Clostridia bacterium]